MKDETKSLMERKESVHNEIADYEQRIKKLVQEKGVINENIIFMQKRLSSAMYRAEHYNNELSKIRSKKKDKSRNIRH